MEPLLHSRNFPSRVQAAFREPGLQVLPGPRLRHLPLSGTFYINLPAVLCVCDPDSPLLYVDVAIPCDNKEAHSVGLMWWMLAWEVLHMCGTISRGHQWKVMPNHCFYRDPEEIEK